MQTISAGGVTWTGTRSLQEAIAYAQAEGYQLVCGLLGAGNLLWYVPCDQSFGTIAYWRREE
jgi:hypothetical protein